VPSRLQQYQDTYRSLAAELAQIGFIRPGSLVSRTTSCGKPGCRCQGDPPQRHGPYYQWSRAIAGKTISRRLNESEADLYRDWIANWHHLEQITQMEEVSAAAAEILLRQSNPHQDLQDLQEHQSMSTQVGGRRAIEKCGTSARSGAITLKTALLP
jgi:hypothetical protein